jgi:hypothetical protein
MKTINEYGLGLQKVHVHVMTDLALKQDEKLNHNYFVSRFIKFNKSDSANVRKEKF